MKKKNRNGGKTSPWLNLWSTLSFIFGVVSAYFALPKAPNKKSRSKAKLAKSKARKIARSPRKVMAKKVIAKAVHQTISVAAPVKRRKRNVVKAIAEAIAA